MSSRAIPNRPRRRPPALRSSFQVLRLEDRLAPAVIAWDGGPGGTGTEWNVPANWVGNLPPGSGDEAQIGAAFSAVAITHSAGSSIVQKVTSEAAITVTGGILALAGGASTSNKTLTVANGGTLELRNASLNAAVDLQGTLFARGASKLLGPVTTTAATVVRVQGDNTFFAGDLTVANGFTNNGVIELTADGNFREGLLTVTAGTLTNAATGQILALPGIGTPGARILTAVVDNQGLIDAQQSLTVTNTGKTFTCTAGAINVATGKVLTISGGASALSSGKLSGTGAIDLAGIHGLALPADFTHTGSPQLSFGGTVTVNGPGTLINAGSLELTGDTFATTAPLTNQGNLLVRGTCKFDGPFTSSANSELRVQGDDVLFGGNLTVANGFTNNGVIELTAVGNFRPAILTVTAGTLTNAPLHMIVALPGIGSPGARTLSAVIDNQGLIDVQQSLTVTNTSKTFTCTAGAISVATGKVLTISGGTSALASGNLSGAGFIDLAGTHALSLPADFTHTGSPQLSFSGTVTVNGPGALINAGNLELTSEIVNAPLTNQGTVLFRGTCKLLGPVSTAASSVLRVQGDNVLFTGSLTVANSFSNNGTIELTSTGDIRPATLTVTAGNLTNAASGSIIPLPGTGGARTLTGRVINQGVIDIQQSMTVIQTGKTFESSAGSIGVPAGKVLTLFDGASSFVSGKLSGAGTIDLTGSHGLSLPADFTHTGSPQLSFGGTVTVNGPGTFINAGSLTLSNDTFTVNAPLLNQGKLFATRTCKMDGPVTTAATSLIQVQGTSSGGATLTVANGFTNLGTVELTSVGAVTGATLNITAGTLVNDATAFIKSLVGAGGARALNAELNNQGALTIEEVTTVSRASAKHVNTGTIGVTADLTVTQSGTTPSFSQSGGSIGVAAGKTLRFTGGTFAHTGGTTTVDGTLIPSVMNLAAGTLEMSATGAFSGALNQSGGALQGAGTATLNGTSIWSGGTMTGPGKTVVPGLRSLTIDTSAAGVGLNGRPVENNGTVTWVGSNNLATGDGSWVNKTGSVFNANGDAAWTHAFGSGATPFTTEVGGQFKRSTGTGTTRFDGLFRNAGTVLVLTGTLQLNGGDFSNAGAVSINTGTSLSVTGKNLNQSGGTTIVEGNLAAAGLNLQAGTLTGRGIVNGPLNNIGGTVSPGLSPGTLTGNGDYTQQAGGTLTVELNGQIPGTEYDQLAVNGVVNLGGPLQVTAGFSAKVGDSFVIIANDGTDPVNSEFAGLPDGAQFTLGKIDLQIDYQGGTGNDVTLTVSKVTTIFPPTATIQVNGGAAQRSMVTSVTVTFSEAVSFPSGIASAFSLLRTGPGTPTGAVALALNQTGNVVTMTFNDPTFAPVGKSLIDGNYSLTLVASKISGVGGFLDGDGNLIGGDDKVQLTHRLFGDADGDRDVDAVDFGAFRSAFGGANVAVDFDADGDVDAVDFGQFRTRFGASL